MFRSMFQIYLAALVMAVAGYGNVIAVAVQEKGVIGLESCGPRESHVVLFKSEYNERPSSSPVPESLRKMVAKTNWQFKNIRVSLHEDGTVGYYFKGGKWKITEANYVQVYDKLGDLRVTLTINPDLKSGSVVWRDGTKHTAKRFK